MLASMVLVLVSLTVVGGVALARRNSPSCTSGDCISQDSKSEAKSLVGMTLKIPDSIVSKYGKTRVYSILISSSCTSCKVVQCTALSERLKKKLYLPLLLTTRKAVDTTCGGFLPIKGDVESLSKPMFQNQLSNIYPQLVLVDSKGLVLEHLIGALPINNFGVTK